MDCLNGKLSGSSAATCASFWLVIYAAWGVIRWQAYCGRRRKMIKREQKDASHAVTPRIIPISLAGPPKLTITFLYLSTVNCNMPHAVGGMKIIKWSLPSPGFVTPHGNRDKVATLSSHRLCPSWRLKRQGEIPRFLSTCPANSFAVPATAYGIQPHEYYLRIRFVE